jgi:hypothetical protein
MKLEINKNKKLLFNKYSLIVGVILIGFLIATIRVLFYKEKFVTVEMFASGGEWWWQTPNPPYWLADSVKPGGVEKDFRGRKVVEILDIKRVSEKDRKLLWIKANLLVTEVKRTGKLRFGQNPLAIGLPIIIAPNNISINANVQSIEGVIDEREKSEKIITVRLYNIYPWQAENFKIGQKMRTDENTIVAELIDKEIVLAEITVTTDLGQVFARLNPLKRDLTLRVKVKTIKIGEQEYFAFLQPIKENNTIYIPFEDIDLENANIISIEEIE